MEQGATIGEAARILGISENAVLQRIKRGTLPAKRDAAYKWRVVIGATDQQPTSDRPTDHADHAALRVQQEGAALVIREAIAPFIAELRATERRLGAMEEVLRMTEQRLGITEEELHAERTRREGIERERDELRAITLHRSPAQDNLHISGVVQTPPYNDPTDVPVERPGFVSVLRMLFGRSDVV